MSFRNRRAAITILLSLAVFLIDLAIDPRIAVQVLYLAVMVLTLSFMDRRATLTLAVLATCLSFVGYLLSEPVPGQASISILNRLLALFAIWTVWLLADQRMQGEQELRDANESLDDRIRRRTNELESTIARLNEEVIAREATQAELEQQTRLLNGLMDAIPDNIYFKDREGRYLRINRAKAARSGLASPEEAVGKTDFDFFQEAHARQAMEAERASCRPAKSSRARTNDSSGPTAESPGCLRSRFR
ncbi:MAG: PAS domain-containing protein [Planctomycetaceae bacterium]